MSSSVEQNVVIVAACVHTLRPFFYKAFGGHRNTHESSFSNSQPTSKSFFPARSHTRMESVSEVPLEDIGKRESQGDAESQDTRKEI